jgi:hypothetical protein
LSKRALIFSDLQIPYEDKRSLAAVEKYMKDHDWDYVGYIGDFVDMDCISSHNANNLRAVEGKSIQADYDYANRLLDRHQRLAPNAKWFLIEGNHEYRVERYLDAAPTLRGSIEVEKGLRLKERGIKWVRNWSKGEVYRIGKANFIHGLYTNDFHSKRTVQVMGASTFFGHTHDIQSYSAVLRGDNSTIVGQSIGCLCQYDQSYLRGRPTKWQQGFAVFHFLPDGNYNYYIPRLFNHRFVAPEGVTYSG